MKTNFFCFSRNGKYYAIDTVRIIPLQLDYTVYSLLNEIQIKNYDSVDLKDFVCRDGYSELKTLAQQNILFHCNIYKVENSFRELNISLIPTLACNLNCRYCYSSRKKENKMMPLEVMDDAIKFFCRYFSFSNCRIDFVSGGEPLYNYSALISIMDRISYLLDKYNKKSFFWLCTNGVLLNEHILKYLDKKHVNIGISIDGPEDIHDANRVDIEGNGTYKKIVTNLLKFNTNKELSRNIKNLWNCAVVTSSTHSLIDIMRNSYQLGFKNLQMKIVWSNDNSIRLSEENTIKLYDELTQYLFELIKESKLDEFLSICNENDTYGKILLRIIIQSGVTRRCNAGVNKFSISPEGKLYPCDSFLGIDDYCVGDIYKGLNSVYSEFNNLRNDSIEKCSVCWIKYLCGGDCYYNSYLNSGSFRVPDDKVCFIMKEISQMCIALVVDLYFSFPQEMKKIYNILSKKVIRMEPKNAVY